MNKEVKKLSKNQVDDMVNVFLEAIQLAETNINSSNSTPEQFALATGVRQKAKDAIHQLTNSPDSSSTLEVVAPIAREAMILIGRLIIANLE